MHTLPKVVPIGSTSNGQATLTGSAFLCGRTEQGLLFATALHNLQAAADHQLTIFLPPHNGNILQIQTYPQSMFQGCHVRIASQNPFADLCVVEAVGLKLEGFFSYLLPILSLNEVNLGDQVITLGYPFAVIGSTLETMTQSYVSAKAKRMLSPERSSLGIDEFALSLQGHPGLSGSPVLCSRSGKLYGILRASLSTPAALYTGNVPIGTDSSVTFAVSASYLAELIQEAEASINARENQ